MSDYAKRRRMMVDTQVRPADVTKFPIIDAMLTVPREAFVPRDRMEAAYMSENIAIGGSRDQPRDRQVGNLVGGRCGRLDFYTGQSHGNSPVLIIPF